MASSNPTNPEFPNTRGFIEKILENSLEGIAIIGEDMRIEYVNNRVCEIIGRTRVEIIGQSLERFIHPDSSAHMLERFASGLREEQISPVFEVRVICDDDTSREIRIHTTAITNGENKSKIMAQFLDVTEVKLIQQTLSEREIFYQTLIETMNEGLGVIDDRGVLVHVNVALCEMLNYTEEELVGMMVPEIMCGPSTDEVFNKIKNRIAGNSERYETNIIHRSGRLIPVMVSASPWLNDDGEYIGSFAIITDVTRQKVAERNLQTARNRALLYLDMMGHDIRNHLQEIQVSTELLQYRTDDSSTRGFLERILHAVSKSAMLIGVTKTIEQIAELPLGERILDDALNESVKAASLLLEDVEFHLSLQVSGARIRADKYLELLLTDLLANAYEHNPNDQKQVWVSLTAEESTYELIISDNGPGLSDSAKNSLFDLSQRSGGVHLHLACHIIEKYGGSIEVLDRVQSDPNQGSKIKVIFPNFS